MFERFTESARKVLLRANQEPQRLHHEYLGTEHVLYGLAKHCEGKAGEVLNAMGVDKKQVHQEIIKVIHAGPAELDIDALPHTERLDEALRLAIDEARQQNSNEVGTEHILLGLLHEVDGGAAKVLEDMGISLEDIRAAVQAKIGTTAA